MHYLCIYSMPRQLIKIVWQLQFIINFSSIRLFQTYFQKLQLIILFILTLSDKIGITIDLNGLIPQSYQKELIWPLR